MIYTCRVCSRTLVSRSDEALYDGTFPEVVSYVTVLEGDYCCSQCVANHDRPGKFEGHRNDRTELARCLILYTWMGDGSYEDDRMANEGWGYCSRIGRYLVMEDTQGFVSFEEYQDDAEADKRFMELYADGMGADEEDAYLAEDGSVWFAGKQLDVWLPHNKQRYYRDDEGITERRKLARIRLEMIRTGFYPNVWREHHYGITLVQNV